MSIVSFAYKWVVAAFLAIWMLCPIPIRTLMVLMMLDFVAGGVVSFRRHHLRLRPGIIDLQIKALTMFLLLGCRYMSMMTNSNVDYGSVLAVAFGIHYFSSFVHYCAEAGVPIPPALVDFLVRVRRAAGWKNGDFRFIESPKPRRRGKSARRRPND